MKRLKIALLSVFVVLGLASIVVLVLASNVPGAQVAGTIVPSAVAGSGPVQDTAVQPGQPSSTGTVCFVGKGVVSCVERTGIQSTGPLTDQVRSLMVAMVAGPTIAEQRVGVRSSLPPDAALVDVSAANDRAVIRFHLPAPFLSTFDAGDVEDINEQVATTLTPFNFARIDVEARDPSSPNVFRPLSTFLPPIVIPTKPGEIDIDTPTPLSSLLGGQPPEPGQPQSIGGLSGKTVFVSAGHGWYWNSTLGQFRTQRPHYPTSPYPAGEGTIEDFNNAELVNQYLLQYLWNAGADAWTVRERDVVTSMIVVDNASPRFSLEGSWSEGASGGYNTTYYSNTTVTSGATATATWTFMPTVDAEYAVYAWFPNVSNRTPAARYTVDHAGGTTALTITQQRDGINWRYIGTYPFRVGSLGRVRLSNQSTVAGKTVLADAIRIGGGMASVTLPGAPGPSGKPRWEEQARQYAMWVGLPDASAHNDVIVRPIYSEWEYESGEDAVYISWHTNGFNGYNTTARGTETYIHSFEPTPLSDRLQFWVHRELLDDIHAGWEATWPNRGQKAADLGELRLLDTMPGVLIENGYHDSPTDTDAIKDPRFNLLSARAVYQGIVRYWNEQDPNVPLVFLPEPPTHLRVRNSGPNQVTLAWRPGTTDTIGLLGGAATSYRVYTSTDGIGWGNAISTTDTTLTLTGLTFGQLIYVRVTGVNAGGESFPTPVLAARVTSNGVAPVLIVYGFDRIDRLGLIKQNDPPEGDSRRMFLDRINRYDSIVQHAMGTTHAFDSAVHAAVTDGDVGLGNYAVVDWIAGEEQSPDTVLNATDQSLLQSFLVTGSGRALLISGGEIGFDLVSNGIGPSFYSDTLRASFVVDDASTYRVSADGLVGYWKLDEGSGISTADSSSHSNDGALIGNPVWVTDTSSTITFENPYALLFDGSDSYVDVPHHSSLQMGTDMTVAAWVKTSNADGSADVIVSKWGLAGNRNYWLGKLDSTTIAFYVDNAQNVTANLNLINDGNWHHVAGVADASSRLLRIYVDGTQRNTAAYDGTSETGTADVNMGASEDSTVQIWDGWIDDVRIYSRALSGAEVADLASGMLELANTGIFDGLGTFSFDDGTHGTYDADRPDAFTPVGSAASALVYSGGSGGTAALTYSSGACTRLVYMGFPLETIYLQSIREALMSRAMAFLDECVAPTSPMIGSTAVMDGFVGQLYSYQAQASGAPPLTWSLVSGPGWMSIDATTGRVSGTPTAAGDSAVTIQATNSAGSDTQTYTLAVSALPPQLVTLQASDGWDEQNQKTLVQDSKLHVVQQSDDVRVEVGKGHFMSFQFDAGVPAGATVQSVKIYVEHHEETRISPNSIVWQVGSGVLNAPTVLQSIDAVLLLGDQNEATVAWDVTQWINTAVLANDVKFVVRNNTSNARKTRIDRVYVNVTYSTGPTAPTITSTPVTRGIVGQLYSYQAQASGAPPITWSLVNGPGWMSIDSTTGLVSGTPTAAGDFAVTIQATNSAGSDTQTYTLTVESAITDIAITAVSAPNPVVRGDVVAVSVTVENVGNQDVTSDINVALTDDTDSITIGTQTISGGLAAGATTTLTYSWNTQGASVGNHTLTASHNFADADATNNSKSTTVTVNEPTPGVTVTSIVPNTMRAGTTISVTITGSGFVAGANLTFENGVGPAPTTSNVVVVANTITATVTVGSGGPPRNRVWDVRVTNPDGSTGDLVDGFTVTP